MLIILLSIICTNLFAHDIEVKNADGKTIYYNWIWEDNKKTGVAVTYKDNRNHNNYQYNDFYIGDIVIPESVTYNGEEYTVSIIGDDAFYGCVYIKSVTIPNSVTSIGSRAFMRCTGLYSITIPHSVTSIASEAFRDCHIMTVTFHCKNIDSWFKRSTHLTKVIIGDEVVSIGERAFLECVNLESLIIGKNVKSIGKEAFRDCNGPYFHSIIIPNSVETIDDFAFANFKLESVSFGNSVSSIGTGAFQSNDYLTSVTIPNCVTSIGDHAFSYCDYLSTINIPLSVTSIGNNPFYKTEWYKARKDGLLYLDNCLLGYKGDKPIGELVIENGTRLIADYAFKNCSGLTSITIPNSVTSIGNKVFQGCSGLTSVTIPNSVTSIGYEAFEGCSGMTSIIIGNNVMSIGNNAFLHCSGLTTVTSLNSTPPTIFINTFYNYSATLKVPIGSKTDYQNAKYWMKFKNIVEIDPVPTHKLTYMVDGELYRTYDLEEGAAITPEPAPTKEGYTFSGWSDIPKIMPNHDVTVTGTFTKNPTAKYKLTYMVDGEVYKTYEMEEGATITPEAAPTKEGYTFSGWSEIPETMPNHDVTVTGTFTKTPTAKYKLTYMVDGEVYKIYEMEEGAAITSEAAPTKEGYTFSGWSEIPKTMPNHDVTVTGTFTKNPDMLNDYYVDLGLPSGLLWATCNLGASSPEKVGGYYAWGETSPKTYFSRDNYKYKNNTISISNISGTAYDAATSALGETWRMPTKEELEELANKCTRTETTLNGKACMMFTGPNGNSLYLPKGGFGDEGNGVGLNGYGLWSSTGSGSYAYRAWEWSSISVSNTWQGIPIRPVTSVKPTMSSGDANGDGEVNAADIVEAVNAMNGITSAKFKLNDADMNQNGRIDQTDINMIVNIIIGHQ